MICPNCNKVRARLMTVERNYLDLREKVKKIFPELLKENKEIKNKLEKSERKLNMLLEERQTKKDWELDEITTILKENKINRKYINEIIKITKSKGAVRFDYADVLAVIKNRRIIIPIIIQIKGKNKFDNFENKINLLNKEKYDRLIINIISNEKLTLNDITSLVKKASKILYNNATIVWSSTQNKKMKDKIKIFMLYAK